MKRLSLTWSRAESMASAARAFLNRGHLIYGALFSTAAIAALAKNLVYARILPPTQFGVVALAILITNFCAYFATAGILEGLAREVPMFHGQGRDSTHLRSSAMTSVLILTVVVGGLVTAGSVIAVVRRPELGALLWAGPFLIATVAVNSLLIDLQAREYSVEYAGVLFLKSFLAMMLALSLAKRFGASGILIAETSAMLMCAALCLTLWSRGLRWNFDYHGATKDLLRLGMPFTISYLLQNVAMSIDRWAVQMSFGVATLGVYAFAMNFASMGLVLLNMVQLYATPRVLRSYSVDGEYAVTLRQVKYLAIGTIVAFGVGAMPIMFLFPWFIKGWYPRYIEANQLVIWVYIGTAGITISFFDILFRAVANGRPLVWIQAGAGCVGALACAVAVWWKAPVVVFAIIFAATRFLASAAGWIVGVALIKSENPSRPAGLLVEIP